MKPRFDEPDDFWDIDIPCPDCDGTGKYFEDGDDYKCSLCNGSGEITVDSREQKKKMREEQQLENYRNNEV